MTPTPPPFDRRPTRYPADPDHSVDGLELPPGWGGTQPPPVPDPLGRWAVVLRIARRVLRWLFRRGR